jgi:hypothetical protein
MKGWGVPLLLLAACAGENPDLVIERQAGTVAQATEDGWKRGSVILAGDAGTFTFPHSLALRISIVDDVTLEMPTALAIASSQLELSGAGQGTIAIEPVCEGMYCTAEVTISAAGETVLAVTADGPEGGERDCVYYAVVDASADTDALRANLEARQRDCRFAE